MLLVSKNGQSHRLLDCYTLKGYTSARVPKAQKTGGGQNDSSYACIRKKE